MSGQDEEPDLPAVFETDVKKTGRHH
jgi:hypothetical protein